MIRALVTDLLLYLLLVNGSWAVVNTANNDPLPDGVITTVSLTNYSDNEAFTKRLSFDPEVEVTINVLDIPTFASFIVLQIHTYEYNITLSYDKGGLNRVSHRSIYGSNVGLYIEPDSKSAAQAFLKNDNVSEVDALLVIVAYRSDAPIPGGCNMEFDIEIAPYQKLVAGAATIVVDAQLAAAPARNGVTQKCEDHTVAHEMYRMFLPEYDLSPETYFASISRMLTVDDILENGVQVSPSMTSSPMRRVYSAYVGTGSVYVVVATYKNRSSAYVPAFTYACSPALHPESCTMLTGAMPWTICVVIFALGIFSVTMGYRIFRFDIMLPISLTGGILGYTLAAGTVSSDPTADLCIALTAALVAAFAWIHLWSCNTRQAIMLLASNVSLGFFCASIAYFNVRGSPFLLESNWVFWPCFVSVMLLVSAVMSIAPFYANAVTCAVYGSYMVVAPIDYLTGSSLKYIIINTIRRATVSNFSLAVVEAPIQHKDIILIILWTGLAMFRLTRIWTNVIRNPRSRRDPSETTFLLPH